MIREAKRPLAGRVQHYSHEPEILTGRYTENTESNAAPREVREFGGQPAVSINLKSLGASGTRTYVGATGIAALAMLAEEIATARRWLADANNQTDHGDRNDH